MISWLTLATYSQDGDCRATEPVVEPGRGAADSMYRKMMVQAGKTPEEIEALMSDLANGSAGQQLSDFLMYRGQINGKPVNVYQNPESVPDPQINIVTGQHAIGFNLDGKGADEPGSFQDPYTHEKGVDNEYFRAVGCITSSRATPPHRPGHWGYAWHLQSHTSPAWLISITGEDLSRDGEVTVTFNKAVESTRLDARAVARRDMTFRIDPNPRNQASFRGRLQGGQVTIEPGPFKMIGESFIITFFDIENTHLRLQLKDDGTLEGVLGGYQTWEPIWFFYGGSGIAHEVDYGINMPGVYYALKKLADADPDPVTGQNRRISAAYTIEAVPAFAVSAQQTTADLEQETARTDVTRSRAAPESIPASTGGAPTSRRLTATQYRRIVADVFGPSINVSGRFEPEVRSGPVGGLTAVGAGLVSVSATGFEQYNSTARAIAAKVVDESNRGLLVPCKPASETVPDRVCASQFLSAAGRYLYRRPLTSRELHAYVGAAERAGKTLNSFYAGLEWSLAGMLQSLPFLFREERAEPDPDRPGQYRLNAFSKASRLSFLLWDSAPDARLLAAAESGEIHTREGLTKQVDRLLASPRLEDGIRAFFNDMLHLDQLATLSKDSTIYPKYTADVARDGVEQTLRTITHHVLRERNDYRDLFTTPKTFLTPLLASVYGVQLKTNAALGELDAWYPYEYPQGDPRASILTQVSFVSLHSHPGRTSPTLRGKALREVFFCEKVPDPPANVDFTQFEQSVGTYKTTRERLSAHSTQPMCAGCHKITDPMGLALENFDSAGGFRSIENGARIDTSGSFQGKKFADAVGLSKVVREYPNASSCMVEKLYAYAVGRSPEKGEADWLNHLKRRFGQLGYRIPDLLAELATSDAFYRVTAPEPSKLAQEARQ